MVKDLLRCGSFCEKMALDAEDVADKTKSEGETGINFRHYHRVIYSYPFTLKQKRGNLEETQIGKRSFHYACFYAMHFLWTNRGAKHGTLNYKPKSPCNHLHVNWLLLFFFMLCSWRRISSFSAICSRYFLFRYLLTLHCVFRKLKQIIDCSIFWPILVYQSIAGGDHGCRVVSRMFYNFNCACPYPFIARRLNQSWAKTNRLLYYFRLVSEFQGSDMGLTHVYCKYSKLRIIWWSQLENLLS